MREGEREGERDEGRAEDEVKREECGKARGEGKIGKGRTIWREKEDGRRREKKKKRRRRETEREEGEGGNETLCGEGRKKNLKGKN